MRKSDITAPRPIMTKHTSILIAAMLATTTANAAVNAITAIETTPTATNPQLVSSTLLSFTSGGVTYTSFTQATLDPAVSGERFWATDATDPGSDITALTDLDVVSGVLNSPNTRRFDFTSVTADDVFFSFALYGDQPGSILAVNAAGSIITELLAIPNLDSTANLFEATVERESGAADLTGRHIRGFSFTMDSLTFTGGNTIGDIAGFRFSSGNLYDATMVGIAHVIPEPGSYALLFGTLTLGGVLMRRRRRET